MPGCSRHLVTMLLLGNLQHAHFRRHHDAVVAGDEIARRAQAIAVERGADLAAVGERDRGRAVPRLHDRGVIFVERAALLIHQGIAGPGFRNHHHHGVRQRVAALHQEFEAVVEAGGVGLALIGDRPQPADVLAIQVRMHRGLPRRHPVDVAAQRVDLAVMRDHPVRMRQRPGRESVGREPLMHQRQRALEIGLAEVGIILAELVGEEHALVDDGPARQRHRVIAGEAAVAAQIDRLRNRLAQDVEPALEILLVLDLLAAADEHLHVRGFGRLDGLAERAIVGRHVAPAEQYQSFVPDLVGDDALDDVAPCRFLRHEQRADGIFARLRQLEADLAGLAHEKRVRNLHQDAGAVAGARIGADRAAMFEVAEDADRVGDDLMRLPALDVGNEADAAGNLLERGIVETLGGRAPAELARRLPPVSNPGPPTAHPLRCFRARTPTRSCPSSQIRLGPHRRLGAPWAFAAPTGPPLALREPQFHKFRFWRPASPKNGLACSFLVPCQCLNWRPGTQLSWQSRAGFATKIKTVLLS